MVDFELFCEIDDYLNNSLLVWTDTAVAGSTLKEKIIFYAQNAFHIKPTGSDDAFYALVYQCDQEELTDLMHYFEPDAPIQKLLQKRLQELQQFAKAPAAPKSAQKNFYEYLCEVIDQKGYQSDADFYNYAGISRQTFSKLRNQPEKVSREMALHLAGALELNYEQAEQLLSKAGYGFRSSDKREAIISYLMRNKKYTFSQLNELLFMFHEKTFIED